MTKKLCSLVLTAMLAAAIFMVASVPALAASSPKALEGVTSVSAGNFHTCAVAKKRVYCWGQNNGQLGDGTVTPSLVPIRVYGLGANARAVAVGGNASCSSTRKGVKCWGEVNGHGGYAYTPITVKNSRTPITAIDVADPSDSGSSKSLCMIVGARFGCKGMRTRESLDWVNGLGGRPSAVAAGHLRCTIVSGAAKCWGTKAFSSVPTVVPGLERGVTAIASSENHSCAVVNGAAKCWGRAWGTNPLTSSTIPFDVPTLGSGVTAIATGDEFSCAVVRGVVKCWGWNFGGSLGDGTMENSATPVPVKGLSKGVTALAAGGGHACALADGRLKCWGVNALGQLGNGATADIYEVDPSKKATTVVAPGRTIRARPHRQAKAFLQVEYDQRGVAVDVGYRIPPHMWVKDACPGSVSISLSGSGFSRESRTLRFGLEGPSCVARVHFGPRPPAHEDVVLRVRSGKSDVVKPIRIKRTVEFVQCVDRGCP